MVTVDWLKITFNIARPYTGMFLIRGVANPVGKVEFELLQIIGSWDRC
jgi:hypothetical protein